MNKISRSERQLRDLLRRHGISEPVIGAPVFPNYRGVSYVSPVTGHTVEVMDESPNLAYVIPTGRAERVPGDGPIVLNQDSVHLRVWLFGHDHCEV